MTLPTGVCRLCHRARPVIPTSRHGGGNYRRGGRWYTSSLCVPCATQLLASAQGHAGETVARFSIRSIRARLAYPLVYGLLLATGHPTR